ncbi:T9SS type A sorting domain-containing protein [Ulvibacter litoralis]|uniref:Por secretion system C-terminal sorting domain-containing protein n=1 Tax=Ulvibacter litoralis TaxID=227084 RepID=A0A1G7CJ91_9FLAO|nr:T9SS type A sorting domain-containing protein [Ulvibacter litoralis]GHC47122.1 hypothetical protein GCM10008083_07820 [Ulvibacter litoralis]SDE39464.1 Por secretion system C-terminal sorting domain-containing protein [Ulvibacter litoralis]
MKRTTLFTYCLLLVTSFVWAQTYTTPNTGVTWTLDDIATNSPSTITVSGNNYTLLENLEIAENDTVEFTTDLTLSIEADLRVTVFGAFTVVSDDVLITAVDEAAPYDGFRFEEFSVINIQNATIQYGGGLRVLTETFTLNNCTLTNNVSGVSTGAVVSLSRGMPEITNNTFTFNELPAVSSGANSDVSPLIANNYMEGNNQSNSNRPQINMGSTMTTTPLRIIENTIIGDPLLTQVGGIAVANLIGGAINAEIDGNIIQGNRYGMTIVGPSFAYVRDNIIEDNNTQGNPGIGGSGISLNSSGGGMEVIASGNEIRRNLWGITVIGQASVNLGDDVDNEGLNVFSENGNNGEVYALYNNTPNVLQAKHNCWIEGQINTLADAESVIFHQVDDASLGEVIFDPVSCGPVAATDEFLAETFSFYPNPVKETLHFNNTLSFETVSIYTIEGRLINTTTLSEGENTLRIEYPAGVYLATFSNDAQKVTRKLIVE